MRSVPPEIDADFFDNRRSSRMPFCVNDSVDVLSGPHAGRRAAVISVESWEPTTLLVEFGDDGSCATLDSRVLGLILPSREKLDHAISLMEAFASGDAVGTFHAQKLETAILELVDLTASLEDLADDLAQYAPSGTALLLDYETMKSKVASQLAMLRKLRDST